MFLEGEIGGAGDGGVGEKGEGVVLSEVGRRKETKKGEKGKGKERKK